MFSFRSSDLKLCVQCALLAVALSGNGKYIFLVRVPSKATSSSLAEKQHASLSLWRRRVE
jgi:hypothetical protein